MTTRDLRSLPRVAALLAAAVLALPAAASPTRDGTGWRLDRLDMSVTIDGGGDHTSFSGRVTLTALEASFGPTLAVNTRETVNRFRSATPLDRPDVSASLDDRSDGAPAARLASLRAETPFAPGDTLVVDFELERIGEGPQAIFREGIALASWVEAWYPVPIASGSDPFDGDAMTAPGTTTFTLPANWTAVSNGARTRREVHGDTAVETWTTEIAVARAFTAAPYRSGIERIGGREIGVYLLTQPLEHARAQAATLARALEAMESRFGEYPYASYAIAEVPENLVTWSAASEQGFITAVSSIFDDTGGNLPLFAHEAAHGWWGNLVMTTGIGAAMCSEALAQYGAVVAIESLEGESAARDFFEYSREGYSSYQCANGYVEIVRRGGDKPLAELSGEEWDHNLSDSKGHWFYDMLRRRVGDACFFGTLRDLIDRYAGRRLSLDALRLAFVEACTDDASLERFLAQWLDRMGAPVLESEWWAVDGGRAVELVVTQTQPGDPYTLEIALDIALRSGTMHRDTLALAERTTRIRIETSARPIGVQLDPDHEILMWRPSYGPLPDAWNAAD